MASVTMRDTADPVRSMSFEMPSASPDPGPPPTNRGERRPATSASGYTLLHLDEATADGTAFGERKARFGGAVGTSVATHLLIILGFWALTLIPAAVSTGPQNPPFDVTQLVFLNQPGPGGGGGGGGNNTPDPPAKMQTKPVEKLAVPVTKPAPQTPPKEIPKETPEPPKLALNAPVKPMDAGQIPQLGTIDAPAAPPTNAQGAGSGGGSGSSQNGTGAGSGRGSGLGEGEGGGFGGGAYNIGNGVSSPEILYKTQPQYTAEAMRAKIQGMALLSGIVAPDGTLQDIRIARSLDGTFGLDQEAIKCVRQWRFRPGMKSGRPVPVYVTIEVAFNLR